MLGYFCFASFELNDEVKFRTFAYLALDPDLPFHHLDQTLADGEPQAASAVFPRGRGIGLAERFEDVVLLIFGNADPGVFDQEVQPCAFAILPIERCVERDLTGMSELDGVSN